MVLCGRKWGGVTEGGEEPRSYARLALVRHGRSAHEHRGWVDHAGFAKWRETYEAAGIAEGQRPPAALVDLTARARVVLSSDAPRALSSARALAPSHQVVASPLLRELDLEGPRILGLRLPLPAWALAVGCRMLLLSLRGRYPSASEALRVREAVAWLETVVMQHSLTIVMTHASVRSQIAKALLASGWQAEVGSRTTRHWSAWLMSRRITMQ